MSSIVIAIPVYNEIESIETIIVGIRELGFDFFVVDNNSTDGSWQKALEMGVKVYQRDEFGDGYGCAILKAIQVSVKLGYDYLAFMDCDFSYKAKDLGELIRKREGYDLVLGNRDYKNVEWLRRIGNYLLNLIASLLFVQKIKDLNTGMRVIRLESFVKHLSALDMGMVSQITCVAKREKLKILEIPIAYDIRLGKSKLSVFKDGLIILNRIIVEKYK